MVVVATVEEAWAGSLVGVVKVQVATGATKVVVVRVKAVEGAA